uniref:Uncharacterized protein n=1 Tax=Octopus bimaculoides TaxID=37653 RepID=A0A0L8FLX6_OCTBM
MSVVTYSDDGSGKQGAGSFSVQGLIINGRYRALPTLLVASQARNNLADSKITSTFWRDIENAISRDKIYSNFLVNATSSSSSVTVQALDCITRLISHDFARKSWNKTGEFDKHIQPRVNQFVALKNERFNRLTTCAITLYDPNGIASYLAKYEHVTNQLAFSYCTGLLTGLHLVEPFLSLTTSASTTDSKLVPAFKQLYGDLSRGDTNRLLNVHSPALSFESSSRFQETRYDEDIYCSVEAIAAKWKPEVLQALKRLRTKLADGFQNQQTKLERVPIYNLDSECSVGFINYELNRRGTKQLKLASSQVKSKSVDLIECRESEAFRQYMKRTKRGGETGKKKISNTAVNRRRNHGVPFTSNTEIAFELWSVTVAEHSVGYTTKNIPIPSNHFIHGYYRIRSFLSSEWCMFEYNMAKMECVHAERDLVIVIMLEELPVDVLPLQLKHQVKMQSYICFPTENATTSDVFWKNLKMSIREG